MEQAVARGYNARIQEDNEMNATGGDVNVTSGKDEL